jgi:HK97 family phage major capsid protein
LKIFNDFKRIIANERGDLSLSGLASDIAELNTKQKSFLKEWEDMKSPINELAKLNKEGKGTAEIKEKLDKFEASVSKQEDAIEALKATIKKINEFTPVQSDEAKEKEAGKIEKKAFEDYIRKGRVNPGLKYELDGKILTVEQKDFSIGTPAEGGVLVRPELANSITQMLQDLNPLREIASVKTIGTDKMEILESTGRNAVGWVAEGAARPVTASQGFAQRYINVFELYAQPQASQWSLDDPFLDLEAWLKEELAEDFGMEEGDKFINGNGTTQPKGFLTYPAGTARLQVQQVNSGEAATLTDASIPGLIALQNELMVQYGNNARFVFNRKTRGLLRQLKIDGKFIFAPGIASVSENTILGDPYTLLAGIADVAANSLSIAYGDFSKYQIVDRFGMRMIRDNITVKGKVLFYSTTRVGGDLLNFDAIKILKTAV